MSKPEDDKNIDVPSELIKDLLTSSETKMVKHRFLILNLLKRGLSIRAISSRIGVGTDTVVRVSKMFNKNPKVDGEKEKSQAKSSKWVFGQVSSEEGI